MESFCFSFLTFSLHVYIFFLEILRSLRLSFFTIRVGFFCPLSPLFFGPSLRLDVGPCGEFGNRVHGCTSGSSLWVIYTEREEEKPFWSHVIKKSLLGSVNILGSVRV